MKALKIRTTSCRVFVMALLVSAAALSQATAKTKHGFDPRQGEEELPLGFFSQPDSSTFNDVASELGREGYDYVMPFLGIPAPPNDPKECRDNPTIDGQMLEYLDTASAAGLKVMAELNQPIDPDAPDRNVALEQALNHVKCRVYAVKDHPALWGYYLYDEPRPTTGERPISPPELLAWYDAVKAIDPSHPMLVAQNNLNFFDLYLDVGGRPAMDIIGYDFYPVLEVHPEGEFRTDLEFYIANYKQAATKAEAANVKLFSIPQFFAEPVVPNEQPPTNKRRPTLAEQRYLTFAPILAGAQGLQYFIFEGAANGAPPLPDSSVRDERVHPVADLVKVVRNAIASDTGRLGVTSVAGSEEHPRNETPPPSIPYFNLNKADFKVFGTAKDAYLVAVNNTNAPQIFDFTVSGLHRSIVAEVVGENRRISPLTFTRRGFTFEDTFEHGYAVKVYHFTCPSK